MSVMDMNSRMAMAEKLSVQQLQQAIQSGSLPAYIGIPLIEQKNKEKSQMAAAQQGQQKPPSVAASILQQAEQQEQQEQGISQLPSNLPVMEGEEMGMAEGGIIAFSKGEEVEDPDKDPRIVALRQDPLYLDFVAHGGNKQGDTSVFAFLEDGNAAPITAGGPEYEPSRRPPSRGSYDRPGPIGDTQKLFSSPPSPETASDRAAISNLLKKGWTTSQDIGYGMTRGAGTVADYFNRGLRAIGAPEKLAPRIPDKYTFNRSTQGLTPYTDARVAGEGGFEANYPVSSQPEASETPSQGSLTEGITPASIAASEAALPKPTGTGPRTAPQGGAPSSGRGALPPTLAAAERSDSPVADRATSMLDKYVAQLEKSGEDVGRQKKEALYMALIQGGLAAAGGMSPNALQNIAQGATLGAQNYQQALAGIRKDDRARLEKLISAGLKKEEFMLKAEEIGVKRDTARMVYDAAMARTGAMGGGGGSDAKNQNTYVQATRNYNSAIGAIDAKIAKVKESQFYGMDPAKFPAIASKIKAANDAVAMFEKQKRSISQEHQKFVKELGVNAPDYENRPVGGSDVDLNQFFKKP
jgi:hypothetical protein